MIPRLYRTGFRGRFGTHIAAEIMEAREFDVRPPWLLMGWFELERSSGPPMLFESWAEVQWAMQCNQPNRRYRVLLRAPACMAFRIVGRWRIAISSSGRVMTCPV